MEVLAYARSPDGFLTSIHDVVPDRERPSPGWLRLGDATQFRNGRKMAAWLGLVPRQHTTGGRPKLLGISKHGDR